MQPILIATDCQLALAPVMTDYSTYPSHRVMGGHLHSVYHLVFALDGTGVLEKDRSVVPMEPGDVVTIDPGEKHLFHTSIRAMRVFAFNFYLMPSVAGDCIGDGTDAARLEQSCEKRALGALAAEFAFRDSRLRLGAGSNVWARLLERIGRLRADVSAYVDAGDPGARPAMYPWYALRSCVFLLEVLSLLTAENVEPLSRVIAGDPVLRAVDAFLRERLDRTYRLPEVAAEVGRAPAYLCTSFHRRTGMTIGAYHNSLRIGRACERLRHPDTPITRIALELGYRSPQHFSAAFRRARHMSPREYRQRSEVF
jgi:AraC-like DNA-binding protein